MMVGVRKYFKEEAGTKMPGVIRRWRFETYLYALEYV